MGNRKSYLWVVFGCFIGLLLMSCQQNAEPRYRSGEAPSEITPTIFDPNLHDWPHFVSDLQTDPDVVYGRLENGTRFAIRPFSKAKGDVSIKLMVSTGFDNEPDDQYGIAHLLEHLAFRTGSPDGAYTKSHALQTEGVGFGSDFNAHTSQSYTLYRIFHSGDPERKTALSLETLSEMIYAPSFLPDHIDLERDIVLAERLRRDTAQGRSWRHLDAFTHPTNKRKKQYGIGSPESLARISEQDLRAFHEAHYHPENILIVIVGDVDSQKTIKALDSAFGSANARLSQSYSEPDKKPNLNTFPKDGALIENRQSDALYLISNLPSISSIDTLALRRQSYARTLVLAAFNQRLAKRFKAENFPVETKMTFQSTKDYNVLRANFKSIDADQVVAFEEERLRVLKHGWLPEDISNVQNQLHQSIELIANFSGKGKINGVSDLIIGQYLNGAVYYSFQTALENYEQYAKELALNDYNAAFNALMKDYDPRYWWASDFSRDEDIADTKERIAALDIDDIEAPIQEIIEALDLGLTGRQAKILEENFDDVDEVNSLVLENRTQVHFQNRKDNNSLITIRTRITGDMDSVGAVYGSVKAWASRLSRADIKGVSKQQLERQITRQSARFSTYLDGKDIILSASITQEDFGQTLTLMAAFIQNFDSQTEHAKLVAVSKNKPTTTAILKIPFIYSGGHDSQKTSIMSSRRNTKDMALTRIKGILDTGQVNVGIVGNIPFATVKDEFLQSFGLIKRIPRDLGSDPVSELGHIDPGVSNIYYHGTGAQTFLYYCWPVKTRKKLDQALPVISHAALENEIYALIREDLGLSYSVNHILSLPLHFPEFQYGCIGIGTQLTDEERIHAEVIKYLQSLKEQKLSKATFERSQNPILTKEEKRTQAPWFISRNLSLYKSDLEKWDNRNAYLKQLNAIDARMVSRYVKEQYRVDNFHLFRILPEGQPKDVRDIAIKMSAGLGNERDQLAYAKILSHKDDPDAKAESLEWYEKLAATGLEEAHIKLGNHYRLLSGHHEKAAYHLKQAAGSSKVKLSLAKLYSQNRDAFPDIKDIDIFNLVEAAAMRGRTEAQKLIAHSYRYGQFTKVDRSKALMWKIIALKTQNGAMVELSDDVLGVYMDDYNTANKEAAINMAEAWFEANSDTVWSPD